VSILLCKFRHVLGRGAEIIFHSSDFFLKILLAVRRYFDEGSVFISSSFDIRSSI